MSHYKDAAGNLYGYIPSGIEVSEISFDDVCNALARTSESQKVVMVNSECQRRIYAKWDADQQWNALAGADGYTAGDLAACLDWVNRCRAARDALLADEATLVTIDVTDDSYWPVAS